MPCLSQNLAHFELSHKAADVQLDVEAAAIFAKVNSTGTEPHPFHRECVPCYRDTWVSRGHGFRLEIDVIFDDELHEKIEVGGFAEDLSRAIQNAEVR
jgi:hypothetical protein